MYRTSCTGSGSASMDCWGLYIHIPFCQRKCIYCDFASYVGMESLHADYIRSLQSEIETVSKAHAARFDTIFVGGGTPTLVAAPSLARLSEHYRGYLDVVPDAEVTIEANPGTVDPQQLSILRSSGFNRLSLGVQSLDDADLSLLGRIHNVEQAVSAYYMARRAGFTNINLDLIFGLPGQSVSGWQGVIERAIALRPEHLALYALTVEEDTPIATMLRQGKLPAIDDARVADMYELAESLLAQEGYIHYEISNWADQRNGIDLDGVPRLACAHNLKYWRNERYLGLGAAAHSYDGHRRSANTADPADYVARVSVGKAVTEQTESVDLIRQMGETMMLGLRLVTGVRWDTFQKRFGAGLEETYGREIENLVADGLLHRDACGIRLTARGRLLGNSVFAAFLR